MSVDETFPAGTGNAAESEGGGPNPQLELVNTVQGLEVRVDEIPDVDIIHVVGVDAKRRLALDTILGDSVPSRRREFVFPCNISPLLLGDLVFDGIQNQALLLLAGIAASGDGKPSSRVLIFVGYDLGALILKKAVTLLATKESEWPGIFYSTVQFIFRDCFHRTRLVRGLNTKVWQFLQARKLDAPWASLVTPGSITALSEASVSMTEVFLSSKATLRIGIVSIYAENSDPIFDFFTATLGVSTEIVVQDNPDSQNDPVCDLNDMVCHRKTNWASRPEWIALQRMILPLALPQYQHAVDSPDDQPRILESEAYRDWTATPTSTILYIQGRDETQSKYLADNFLLHEQAKRQKKQKHGVPMLSFCFSSDHPRRPGMDSMICSTIIQILSVFVSEPLVLGTEVLLDQHQLQRGWSFKDLLNILNIVLMKYLEEGGILVLHDLDECEPASRKYFLDALSPIAQKSDLYPRVIITSRRRLSLLLDSGQPVMWYVYDQLDDTTEESLTPSAYHANSVSYLCPGGYGEHYVRTTLASLDPMDTGQLEQILRLIRYHTRWPDSPSAAAFSGFRKLLGQIKSSTSPATLLDGILRSIPDQIGLLWILPWILFGHRPMRCAELVYLFRHCQRGQQIQFASSSDPVEVQKTVHHLRSWLSVLVHIGHEEVYIQRPLWRTLQDDNSKYIWNELQPTAHSNMLQFLSSYLTAEDVRIRLLDVFENYLLRYNSDEKHLIPSLQGDNEDFIFYAVTAFPYHLEKHPQYLHQLKHIFCESQSPLTPWAKMYWAMSNPFNRPSVEIADSALSMLLSKENLGTALHEAIKSLMAAAPSIMAALATPAILATRSNNCKEMDALAVAVRRGNEEAALQHAQNIFLGKTHDGKSETTDDGSTDAVACAGDVSWLSRLLWRATWLNMDRVVTLLLANQVPADPKDVSSVRYPSPLYLASLLGHSQIVRALLRAGADHRVLRGGDTSALFAAAANGHNDTVCALLAEEGGLLETESPTTPLYGASAYGQWTTVNTLLGLGAQIDNAPSDDGWTPLMIAANGGYTRTVQALLENGANPNLLGPGKRDTALWFAVMRGQRIDCIRTLLKHNADPNHEYLQPPLVTEICKASDISSENKILLLDTLVKNTIPIDLDKADENGPTGLMFPASHGDTTLVEWLLAHHVNVSATYDGTYSALYFAVANGNREVIQMLLANGPPATAVAPGESTLLHLSVDQGVEQLGMLLDAGIDPDLEDGAGLTALNTAVVQQKPDIVKFLIDRKANIHHRDRVGWSPIHDASGYRHNAEVVRLLVDAGANLRETLEDGRTALHLAASSTHADIVAILLEFRGSLDIEQPDTSGQTPLIAAAMFGNLESIRRLVQAGADVNAQCSEGDTPLMKAIRRVESYESIDFLLSRPDLDLSRSSTKQGAALNLACRLLQLENIEKLLDKDADVNQQVPGHGLTPLMSACGPGVATLSIPHDDRVNKMDQVVRMLVGHGADVHATPNSSSQTLLCLAAGNAAPSTINYLVSEGLSLTEKDRLGRCPIHYAAINGVEPFNTVLLDGSTLLSTDIAGKTALHWAAQFGRVQTVETILAHARFQGERRKLIDQSDMDGWTALCWALRPQGTLSEDAYSEAYNPEATIRVLLQHGADVSRPCRMGSRDETFTPLELARLHANPEEIVTLLRNADRNFTVQDQPKRTVQPYTLSFYTCDICLNEIWGPVWRCKTCPEFDLCKKCHGQFDFYSTHLRHDNGEPHTFHLVVEAPPEIYEPSQSRAASPSPSPAGEGEGEADQRIEPAESDQMTADVDPTMEAIMDFSVDDVDEFTEGRILSGIFLDGDS